METIFSTTTSKALDLIIVINHYQRPVTILNEDTGRYDLVFTDKENNVCKHRGHIHSVDFVVQQSKDGPFFKFSAGPDLITKIHTAIEQIRQVESEEFFDDDPS